MNLRHVPCPKCQRKGLHYANHPHAFGWKDYSRIVCRFCRASFAASKIEDQPQQSTDKQ